MPVTFMMAHFHYVKYPPHGLTLMSRSDNFYQLQLPAALMCDGISAFLHLQDSVDGISVQSSFRNTMESPSQELLSVPLWRATENTHLRLVLIRDLDPQYGPGSSSEPVAHFSLGRSFRDDNILRTKKCKAIQLVSKFTETLLLLEPVCSSYQFPFEYIVQTSWSFICQLATQPISAFVHCDHLP